MKRPRLVCLLALLSACLADAMSQSAVDSLAPTADTPVSALLGSSFGSEFFNCTDNSSVTSWCDASNPYVIAQPLQFDYGNETGNTTADSGSTLGKFQQMVADYNRVFTCDGEEADSKCRMVLQMTLIDGIAAAEQQRATQPLCSWVDSCDIYRSDCDFCDYCYQSQDICENTCNGTWCPVEPSSTNITYYPDRRIVAMAMNEWSSTANDVIVGASLFDQNLLRLTGSATGNESVSIVFLLTLSDVYHGFKWVVFAQQPNAPVYQTLFDQAAKMGLNNSVPREDCLLLQAASPNPTFKNAIGTYLISAEYRTIPDTDYNTKTLQFNMDVAGINVGAGFLIQHRATGRNGILYTGISADTRTFSSGVIFFDIDNLDGEFVQMQSLAHFLECSTLNASTYDHKLFQRNNLSTSTSSGQGMEDICNTKQLLLSVVTTTNVYVFDVSSDRIVTQIVSQPQTDNFYLFGYGWAQKMPLWNFTLHPSDATTAFSLSSVSGGAAISGAQLLADPLPMNCSSSFTYADDSKFSSPVNLAVSIDTGFYKENEMHLISLDQFDGTLTPARLAARSIENPAGYESDSSPCPDPLLQYRDPSSGVCRARRTAQAVTIPLTTHTVGMSLKSAWVDFGPPQLVELFQEYADCSASSAASNSSTSNSSSSNPFASLIAGLDSSEAECLFSGAVSSGSDALGYLDDVAGENASAPDFSTYAYGFRHVLYSTQDNRRTYIFQVTQDVFREMDCPDSGMRTSTLQIVNDDIVNIGQPFYTIASINGRYVFNIVERQRWELEAQERAVEVCAELEVDPDDVFLSPLSSACTDDLRYPEAGDFLTVASACPPSVFCESFTMNTLEQLGDGYYSNWNFDKRDCPPGYYCPSGVKTVCPTGFYCPDSNLGFPQRCPVDPTLSTSCYASGLDAPEVCANGTICTAPYLPAQPAGPGYYQSFNTTTGMRIMADCEPGDYCNLGRSLYDDLICPNSTACASASVMEPSICDHAQQLGGNISYCPAGTMVEVLCPAGYHCESPDGSKTLCRNGSYCPPGTYSWTACDAGYYCETPANKTICPAGSYCPTGSQYPIQCSVISVCNEGAYQQSNLAAIIILCLLAIVMGVGIWGLNKYMLAARERRARVRLSHKLRLSKQSEVSDNVELLPRGASLNSVNANDMSARIDGIELGVSDDTNAVAGKKKTFTIDFEFDSLGLELKKGGKAVLQGVTGTIRHGRVTAVMGPSGAGKSTFVTTLCGKAYYGNMTGTVKINGIAEPFSKYQTITGFVPQEDVMMRTLTVKENLQFSAFSRLPVNWTRKQKRDFVNETLDTLDLYDIRHSAIGDEKTRGISGGQRKRVNIGMEMVADPTVLFLDEPTSGLDSTSSLEVCACLKKVANQGLTIITVIHQPRYEIFTAIDDVLLLGKGGRTVYLGETQTAMAYFESLGYRRPDLVNPADFMMDAIAGTTKDDLDPQALFDHWNNHMKKEQIAESKTEKGDDDHMADTDTDVVPACGVYEERRQTGCLKVLQLVIGRSFVQQYRDISSWVVDNLLVFVAGLMLGLIYVDWSDECEGCVWLEPGQPIEAFTGCPTAIADAAQPLFMSVTDQINVRGVMTLIVMGLGAVTTMTRVFGSERTVYFREASGLAQPLHTAAYFWGKDIAFLHQSLVGPLLYLLAFTALTAPRASFGQFYLPLVAVYYASGGIGYIVSIVSAPEVSQLIGVISVFSFAMFSGGLPVLVQLKTRLPPFSYIEYISFMRYGLEAFYVAEAQHWTQVVELMGTNFIGTDPDDPGYILSSYGYYIKNYRQDIIICFAIGIMFRIIAFGLMAGMDREKKL